MKKGFLVSILIYAVLMSAACKSKAPPRAAEMPQNTQSGSSSAGFVFICYAACVTNCTCRITAAQRC